MAYVSGNRNATLSLGNRLGEIFSGMRVAYAEWRVYRRTVNALQDLTVRELDDLGISRSGIRAAAMEAAYGATKERNISVS